MTIHVDAEGIPTDLIRDELQDEIWTVVVTIRSRRDPEYIVRKQQTITFLTEEAAKTFHADHGHIWGELEFDILAVDFVKYAQVPF